MSKIVDISDRLITNKKETKGDNNKPILRIAKDIEIEVNNDMPTVYRAFALLEDMQESGDDVDVMAGCVLTIMNLLFDKEGVNKILDTQKNVDIDTGFENLSIIIREALSLVGDGNNGDGNTSKN